MGTRPHMEYAAQALLDHPESAQEIVDDFDTKLRTHYVGSGMIDHQPAKAAYAIARQKRKVVWSSLWHTATDEVILSSLPSIRETDSLPQLTTPQTNSYNSFIDTMKDMFADGSARATGTPDSPHKHYQALWGQAKATQDEYGSTWQDLHDHYAAIDSQVTLRPPWRPPSSEHMTRIWDGAAMNISVTSLWLITNLRRSIAQDTHDPKQLTDMTLQSADVLNWGTTMNRVVNLDLFPDLFTPLPEQPDESFFTHHGSLFTQTSDPNSVTWKHPSLKSGPWKAPGGCAGEAWLQSPDAETRGHITNFFQFAARRFGGTVAPDIEQGRYNGGLAAITLGGFVAEQTIFKAY